MVTIMVLALPSRSSALKLQCGLSGLMIRATRKNSATQIEHISVNFVVYPYTQHRNDVTTQERFKTHVPATTHTQQDRRTWIHERGVQGAHHVE